MWLEIVVALVVMVAFLLGMRMGTQSSSSTMKAATLLWESAQSALQDRLKSDLMLEELRRALSTLEERSKEMEKATARAVRDSATALAECSSKTAALTATVDALDQRTGMVFEALNGGVVLKRGQLQEQVSMGAEVKRAEAYRASRGLTENGSDTPF